MLGLLYGKGSRRVTGVLLVQLASSYGDRVQPFKKLDSQIPLNKSKLNLKN